MSIFSRRQPRHALAPVRAAEEIPARAEAAGAPDLASITLTDKPLDVLRPAAPWTRDETVVFRIPGAEGSSGFVIPPGAPWQAAPETRPQADPEDVLPVRSPGDIIPAASVPALRTEPADPDLLRDLRDALQALPDEPARSGDEAPEPAEITRLRAAMDARPGAWLRAIMPGVRHPWDALPGEPSFAGLIRDPEGLPYAGLYLGDADADGRLVIDVRDPRWLHSLIGAAYEALDAMESGEGTEAA